MISFIPCENWQYSLNDLFTSLTAAILPRKHDDLLNIPGVGNCIQTRSGRAALITALKALNLPPGACIGVPLYCCSVVFKAIATAGYSHCFIDIDPSTYCMSADDLSAKQSEIDAVIAVHMFGNTCDMPAIQKAMQGKPIIEDCAQALYSKLSDCIAGTYGKICFFSFRSGKYLSAGEGGALFSNNQTLHNKLTQNIAALPSPGVKDEITHVAATYLRSLLRSKPLYGLIGNKLWAFYNKNTGYASKSPIDMSLIYKSDAHIVQKRLPFINAEINTQRNNAAFFDRSLDLESNMLCPEKPNSFYNRYLYPIIFSTSQKRDKMADYLRIKKIGCIKPYFDIIEIATQYYGYKGDCPNAERIARGILVIPSHAHLNRKELNHIAHSVNEGWGLLQ